MTANDTVSEYLARLEATLTMLNAPLPPSIRCAADVEDWEAQRRAALRRAAEDAKAVGRIWQDLVQGDGETQTALQGL